MYYYLFRKINSYNCRFRFPAVVKNVVSKNLEVKKLVYVYLVRYAEEQQDLALLSISTFQRALKVLFKQNILIMWIKYLYFCYK